MNLLFQCFSKKSKQILFVALYIWKNYSGLYRSINSKQEISLTSFADLRCFYEILSENSQLFSFSHKILDKKIVIIIIEKYELEHLNFKNDMKSR